MEITLRTAEHPCKEYAGDWSAKIKVSCLAPSEIERVLNALKAGSRGDVRIIPILEGRFSLESTTWVKGGPIPALEKMLNTLKPLKGDDNAPIPK